MNDIIRYVALGMGITLIVFLGYIAWKLHVFSRYMDEARDKDNESDDKDE